MLRKLGIIAVLSLIVAALAAIPALGAPHTTGSNPLTCTLNADQTVTCVGRIAGLGTATLVDIDVDVPFACEVRPGHNRPGGHIQDVIQDQPVRGGHVDLDSTTGPATCPQGLNPVVGDEATITVTNSQTGEVLFQRTVDIT